MFVMQHVADIKITYVVCLYVCLSTLYLGGLVLLFLFMLVMTGFSHCFSSLSVPHTLRMYPLPSLCDPSSFPLIIKIITACCPPTHHMPPSELFKPKCDWSYREALGLF